jgi:flagellar protein FliJ
MAKNSTSTLKMLKEIAAKEVDLAAEALALAMKTVGEAQNKHDLLREYRQDYVKKLNKQMESGISAEEYQNFHNFFSKLDQAVIGQQEMVEFAKRQEKVQRQLWQESQRKKLSYEVLSQRTTKRELKAEQKRDQKMMDEFAMRAGRVKNA